MFLKKTVRRYFKILKKICYQYYLEEHENTILEGHVEIDETQLYRMKKSFARGRPYVYNVWLIGFRERGSSRCLIFPTETRCESFFLPLLLAHVKPESTIYTDCFSVYVNNSNLLPQSKLQNHRYIHKYVNHKITFVNKHFPDIHTNTIERLWKSVKEHTRKHKVKKLFNLCLGRFYFHRTMEKKDQLKYLIKNLHNEYINYFDIEF